MKTIFGVVIWILQLVAIIFNIVCNSIIYIIRSIFGATKSHLDANTNRGKNFVKSYYFLECLHMGSTVEEANRMASTLFQTWSNPDTDYDVMQRALAFSKKHHDGKQLPIISEAVKVGFVSRSE